MPKSTSSPSRASRETLTDTSDIDSHYKASLPPDETHHEQFAREWRSGPDKQVPPKGMDDQTRCGGRSEGRACRVHSEGHARRAR